MVPVDKGSATTSRWKPGEQFRLTFNYTQPNPDDNNIMYTIYNDLALGSLTLKLCICN